MKLTNFSQKQRLNQDNLLYNQTCLRKAQALVLYQMIYSKFIHKMSSHAYNHILSFSFYASFSITLEYILLCNRIVAMITYKQVINFLTQLIFYRRYKIIVLRICTEYRRESQVFHLFSQKTSQLRNQNQYTDEIESQDVNCIQGF